MKRLFLIIRMKSKLSILILFVISFLVVFFASIFANHFISFGIRTMEYNIERRLISVAEHLADFVSIDELDKYQEEEDMELQSYYDLRRKLLDFSNKRDVFYVYFIRPQENDLRYIIDNDFNILTRVGLDSEPIRYEEYIGLKEAKEGKSICPGVGNYDIDWEGLLSAYAPVFDKDGNVKAIAGVDIKDKDIVFARKMIKILTLIQIISITLLFISGLLGLIRFRREARIAEEAQIKAKNASAAKSKFLATMSHEIRTPINAIIGVSEIELMRNDSSPETKDSIGKIYNSGYMLLGIINDILDLSKIETGKFEIIPVKYSTPSLISDTVQFNLMRIGSKAIEFKLRVSENLPSRLFGDELRIKQILNNLLSNAIKYTNEGNVTLSFDIENSEECKDAVNLIITVQDTGQGMTKEQMARLFDEYSGFNIEANRTIEGFGLEMSITKSIVEMMQGKIDVESELNAGTVFTARFMQKIVDTDVIGKELAENLEKFRPSKGQQMKSAQIVREYMPYGSVLVVDDINTNLFVAKGLLAPYGLKIETAISGFEAIEKIKSGNEYSIIFMDHMMPEMDGIEATELIRKTGYAKPIVALTANAVVGQADEFLKSGFDEFISKPIDIRQLNEILKRFIRDKAPPEAIEAANKQSVEKSEIIAQDALAVEPALLSVFAKDAKKTLSIIEAVFKNINSVSDKDIHLFTVNAHAIKSALANIGEKEISNLAALLEKAGKERDKDTLQTKIPALTEALKTIIAKADAETKYEDCADEDPAYLPENLNAISQACAAYDFQNVNNALANLQKMSCSKESRLLIEQIAELVLSGDFEAAGEFAAKSAGNILGKQQFP